VETLPLAHALCMSRLEGLRLGADMANGEALLLRLDQGEPLVLWGLVKLLPPCPTEKQTDGEAKTVTPAPA
jgi:hypothetical protein